MSISHYVLTIEAPDSARYRMCADSFANAGLQPTFVQGIRGLTPEAEALHAPRLARLAYKYPLTDGEIACTFGHWRILKMFLDTDAHACAVYEDDIVLVDAERLNAIFAAIEADLNPPWDVLRLHDLFPGRIRATEAWANITLTRFRMPPVSAAAYIVTRRGAERILARRRIYRPYDNDIAHVWELGLKVRSVVPNPTETRDQTELESSLETARHQMRAQKSLLRSIKGELHALYAKTASALFSR